MLDANDAGARLAEAIGAARRQDSARLKYGRVLRADSGDGTLTVEVDGGSATARASGFDAPVGSTVYLLAQGRTLQALFTTDEGGGGGGGDIPAGSITMDKLDLTSVTPSALGAADAVHTHPDIMQAAQDAQAAAMSAQTTANAAQAAAVDADEEAISRGTQLVTNGNAFLGDVTNWSWLAFDGTHVNGTVGSFTRSSTANTTVMSDDFFPIDVTKPLYFSVDAMSESAAAILYAFVAFFDCDGNAITAPTHMYTADATLTQDLKDGDRVIHLDSTAGWVDTSTTSGNRIGIIAWNYTNSKGYTWPVHTYSRNYWLNLWTPGAGIDFVNNTITMRYAWAHGTIPAGTKISQPSAGASYKYCGWDNRRPATSWETRGGVYRGTDYSGTNKALMFPPGTAKGKAGFLWNYNSADDHIWVTNIVARELYEDDCTKSVYATCQTAAATAAKVATVSPATSTFAREVGKEVNVFFSAANTAATPTLNVNSTGAAQIRPAHGKAFDAVIDSWDAGEVRELVFDGTYWLLEGARRSSGGGVSPISPTALGFQKNGAGTAINVGCKYFVASNGMVTIVFDGTYSFTAQTIWAHYDGTVALPVAARPPVQVSASFPLADGHVTVQITTAGVVKVVWMTNTTTADVLNATLTFPSTAVM